MIEIVQSKPEHLIALSDNIRQKDRIESLRLGVEPLKALTQCFKYAIVRKTILIDGKVAAVFGVTGNLFANQNTLYLATSNTVKQVSSLTFVRTYIQELDKLKAAFEKLVCYVDAEYYEAIKLLELVGFEREQTLTLNDNEFYLYGLT